MEWSRMYHTQDEEGETPAWYLYINKSWHYLLIIVTRRNIFFPADVWSFEDDDVLRNESLNTSSPMFYYLLSFRGAQWSLMFFSFFQRNT